MKAYKFLRNGGVGPFSNFRWPVGEWVDASAALACIHGVHACRIRDLPYWIGPELWEAELEDVREERRKLVARRGRLVGRIEAWDRAAGARFAEACLARIRSRVETASSRTRAPLLDYAADAEKNSARGEVALLGYISARAAEVDGGESAYVAEREAQAAWLAADLGL